MAKKLVDVVTWKGRTKPGQRVIPRHLKLAILARGRIKLPGKNVLWLLKDATDRGVTWPTRLTKPFEELFPEVHVTLELFWQQRSGLSDAEVGHCLSEYLRIRVAANMPDCWSVVFFAVQHPKRDRIADALDVEISRLYAKPRVHPTKSNERRYWLLAYVCIPSAIQDFIQPEGPSLPPALPADQMPMLEGITSPTAKWTARVDASTSATSLGEQRGDEQRVDVLGKKQADGHDWLHARLRTPYTVSNNGTEEELPIGTEFWIKNSGIPVVIAPWEFFRAQLAAWERDNASLSLSERITKLRQLSHAKDLPFDAIIGTSQGTEYLDDRADDPDAWQILKDYNVVRMPDGREIDVTHLLVGLDAFQSPEADAYFANIFLGTNWSATTWGGDVGSVASDMKVAWNTYWEGWNQGATEQERLDHYFGVIASERDLLGDIDVWELDAIRVSGGYTTIDEILTRYYEATEDGVVRRLTTDRGYAILRFLVHYGFSYDADADYSKYPYLPTQDKAVAKVVGHVKAFARVWTLNRVGARTGFTPDASDYADDDLLSKVTLTFLLWLEDAAIENGTKP